MSWELISLNQCCQKFRKLFHFPKFKVYKIIPSCGTVFNYGFSLLQSSSLLLWPLIKHWLNIKSCYYKYSQKCSCRHYIDFITLLSCSQTFLSLSLPSYHCLSISPKLTVTCAVDFHLAFPIFHSRLFPLGKGLTSDKTYACCLHINFIVCLQCSAFNCRRHPTIT